MRYRSSGRRHAAEFEQLKPERFEPGDDTVHRGQIWEATREQRIPVSRLSAEGRERAQHLRPEMAANADLVVLLRVALRTGHETPFDELGLTAPSMTASWVSGRRTLCAIRGAGREF